MGIMSSLFGTQSSPAQALPPITPNELGQHNRYDDAWVAVDGIVYDISKYHRRHPGGDVLFLSAGRDVSDDFHSVHSGSAFKVLGKLPKVAALKPPPMK